METNKMQDNVIPQNNQELRQLAAAALDHWDFSAETDPDGDIKAGLEYYASPGDAVPDEDIPTLFDGYPAMDHWDILQELARGVGSTRAVA
jgi:hypothetical protein